CRAAAAIGAAVTTLILAVPAAAQAPPGTEGQFSYHPTEGARGDSIFFDAKCLWGGSGQGVQILVGATSTTQSGVEFGDEYDVAPDGTISGQLVIPQTAQSGDYSVGAVCHEEDQAFFTSQPGPFTVTGPPLASSTTTTSTTFSTASSSTTASSSDAGEPNKLARTGGD